MSDDPQHVSREYDVFIIFAGCDLKIAEHICNGLEAENLRCLAQWKLGAFNAGKPVFDNVLHCMEISQTTLLILTKDSFSASWVTLETILSLENSVRRGELTLRLLLHNVTESEIGFLKKGVLENIPEIIVNINKDDWQKQLVNKLKSPIQLPDILPVGCLAHGQVFSHFTGYLVYLLPELENILRQTETYKQTPNRVSMKLCMLLPGSCKLPTTLDQTDEESGITIRTISNETTKFTKNHAGKERTLSPPLYSVRKGEEEYFFIGDLPNVLNAMFRIHDKGLAKVDLRFQIARFYYTMIELLNHSESSGCVDKVTLVPYNDSTENLADVVFEAVRQDVLCQQTQAAMSQVSSSRTPQRLLSEQHEYTYDVLIVTCDEIEDCKYAEEILKFLEENGKTVTHQKSQVLDLDVARWVIFMMSKEALFSKDGFRLKCVSVLVDSVANNMLRTLPVLIDVEPSEVPQMIKWVTLVRVAEKNYKERILQTVNGETIRVQDRLPCWDVVTGLAWAYVVNYLVVTLLGRTDSNLDLVGRIQKLLRDEGENCGCVKKLFLLVPRSCQTEDQESILAEANKGFPNDKGPIRYIGFLEPVKIDTGGVHKRVYKFHMYKYTDPHTKQSTCFLSEYVTPIKCLYEMATRYPFAGLHLDDMHKQCDEFVNHLFPTIIAREAVKRNSGDISELAQLVYYDDEKQTLLSALQSQIDEIDRTTLVKA